MSNGITDRLMSLFKKDEEPIIEEGQSALDEWKSTNYRELYPKMSREQMAKYNFSEEAYDDVEKYMGINLDRIMVNLIPVITKRNQRTGEVQKRETHQRLKSIQEYIGEVVPQRDREGYTKEHWKKIEDILYGKYESYDDFITGLRKIRIMEDER
jgi:hypothetical protein